MILVYDCRDIMELGFCTGTSDEVDLYGLEDDHIDMLGSNSLNVSHNHYSYAFTTDKVNLFD